jgi:hypothetical protein
VAVDVTIVTDLFTVPSMPLLCVGFVVVEPCLAALDKLQVGVPGPPLAERWLPLDAV